MSTTQWSEQDYQDMAEYAQEEYWHNIGLIKAWLKSIVKRDSKEAAQETTSLRIALTCPTEDVLKYTYLIEHKHLSGKIIQWRLDQGR